jgi:hypothetical protein
MPPTPRKAAAQPDPPETTELDTSKLVDPQSNQSADTSTPIGDDAEVAARAKTETTPVGDEAEAAALAFHADDFEPPETADSVDDDVEQALSRTTHDGKGDEDPGESDWNGYATEGVEVEGDQ